MEQYIVAGATFGGKWNKNEESKKEYSVRSDNKVSTTQTKLKFN